MKLSNKILTWFVMAMIFIASSGMTLNLHFCANDLKQVSLHKEESNCCKKAAQTKEQEKKKHCDKQKGCDGRSEKNCCKNTEVKAKAPVKADNSVKKESSFLQSVAFLKSYILSFLTFETEETNDKKPQVSLFPLLKEGLYILLGQFRN